MPDHHKKPMLVRWTVFLFLCGFAMLSYVQRTSIGVAAQNIMPELHLSQMQIGWLNAAFATCYAIAQLPGGVLGQRFGARITYTVVGLVGLIATIATPLAPVLLAGTALFLALLAAQGLLGLSQGPVFPMVAAVSQTWFPQRQWAVTNGLISLGHEYRRRHDAAADRDPDGPLRLARRTALDRAAGGAFDRRVGLVWT